MNFLFIQEAGRHEANKRFRESLCLKSAMNRLDGHSAEVWGLNYPQFDQFDERERWADVIFVLENYTHQWLPIDKIRQSKKLKVFWSIDSHCVLQMHRELCDKLRPDIHLNSTERYLPYFKDLAGRTLWFPNAYPKDLIMPLDGARKLYDFGFCGTLHDDRRGVLDALSEFKPKLDNFVIGEEMVKAINSYRIHFNKSIGDDINYRTFETLGCGTFLITNQTDGLEKLFDIGKDLVTWRDVDDLRTKVRHYLHNPEERVAIERKGHETALSRHTYDARCEYLLRVLSEPDPQLFV